MIATPNISYLVVEFGIVGAAFTLMGSVSSEHAYNFIIVSFVSVKSVSRQVAKNVSLEAFGKGPGRGTERWGRCGF